jgi:hypothetical protein
MGRKVTIRLIGSDNDLQHVQFTDFLTQLHAVRIALENVERVISGYDRPSVYFRVTNLSHSSPATITGASGFRMGRLRG